MCGLWWSRQGKSDPEGQAEKFHVKQGLGTFQIWPGKSTCEFLSQLDHLPPLVGCRGGARPVLPGSWPHPPGSLVQLISTPPRMDPKDGQCSLANQSAHHTFLQLPLVCLSLQFCSAQPVSCRGPPFLYPGQCKPSPSAGRKLGFRWPSPCCWFPAEHGPLGLLVFRTACVRPPRSLPRLDQPSTRSAASPSTSSVRTKRTQSFVCASLF